MKAKLLLGTATALALSIGGSANAAMIAGWDFSQYFGDGLLSLDGETLTDTLPANYSNFDPTFGAGAESAAYGTMYLNGQFGSTPTPLDFTDPVVPSVALNGSLSSNINAPAPPVPFDTFNVLTAEGQLFANLQALQANAPAAIVFEANPPQLGENWSITFGGRTFAGTSSITVEFSSNGSAYLSIGTANLNTVDTPFSFAAPGALGDRGYFRLTFAPVGINQPFIDNLSINATPVIPEPGTALLLLAGLVGLAKAGKREA